MTPKNVSPFGSAVWPAIRNIYINVLLYYLEYSNFRMQYAFSIAGDDIRGGGLRGSESVYSFIYIFIYYIYGPKRQVGPVQVFSLVGQVGPVQVFSLVRQGK